MRLGMAEHNHFENTATTAYVDSWEYLANELKRLDLRIHVQVLKNRSKEADGHLSQFEGMFISGEENHQLFHEATMPDFVDSPVDPVIESLNG